MPRTADSDALRSGDDEQAIARLPPDSDPVAREDQGIPRPQVQRIARRYTIKALRTLIMGMDDADPKVRHAAAVEVLNRGHGKAPIVVDHTAPTDQLAGAALEAEINRRLAALAAKYPGSEIVLNPSEVGKK